MVKNARAAVVGGGEDGASSGRVRGGEHGASNFFGRTKRDGADGGTGAAEESAKSAGGFGGGNHVVEKRDQFFPERLMKMVRESAAERWVFARGKGGGDGTGVSRIFHRVQTIDATRQQPPGFRRRDFEIGNEEHKM